MSTHPKSRPLRLPRQAYDLLRRQVLERDGWRCQYCGKREHLEVHRLHFRSHAGEDDDANLITFCRCCHREGHGVWNCNNRECSLL